jgi:mannose-6-phosphate isomerase-like protein (cupin superfamily)
LIPPLVDPVKNSNIVEVSAIQFDSTLNRYISELGYRLEMIKPADSPREALLSKNGDMLRLMASSEFRVSGSELKSFDTELRLLDTDPSSKLETGNSEPGAWTAGRAGMMYRDLIPDRLGGRIVASHIRIVDGGTVADSVHYHKIDFQVIYCLKGCIRVVYEHQGDPFWLRPGDCVLQPPEIRHRVLEAEADSEVIEVTSPAEHETWFDHELQLPTVNVRPNRIFGTQRFVRHQDTDAAWERSDKRQATSARTQIWTAGTGAPDVYTVQAPYVSDQIAVRSESARVVLKLIIEGRGITVVISN